MAYALHAEIRFDDPGAALAAQLEIDARLSVSKQIHKVKTQAKSIHPMFRTGHIVWLLNDATRIVSKSHLEMHR